MEEERNIYTRFWSRTCRGDVTLFLKIDNIRRLGLFVARLWFFYWWKGQGNVRVVRTRDVWRNLKIGGGKHSVHDSAGRSLSLPAALK